MMDEIDKEALIWSYFDGEISVKEQVMMDQLRSTDKEFQVMYEEIKGVHAQLKSMEIQELSSTFSASMQEQIISQFAKKQETKRSINPLFIFGICLAAMSIAFIYSSSEATANMLFGLDYTLDYNYATLDQLPSQVHWSYFLMLCIIPLMFTIDKILDSQSRLNHLPLL